MEDGCICREIGETCMSDFPLGYDLWLATTAIFHLGLFLLGMYFVHKRWTTEAGKKKLSPMDKMVYLNVLGSVLRLVWVANVVNGRAHNAQVFGNAIDALLVRVPQLLWLGSTFYVSLSRFSLLERQRNALCSSVKQS